MNHILLTTDTDQVLDEDRIEENDSGIKRKEKKVELEDLNFFLKSGIILCKLISKIAPDSQIDLEMLEVMNKKSNFFSPSITQAGNLNTKRKNISQFLTATADYGVPANLLFCPDDLAVQAHFYK